MGRNISGAVSPSNWTVSDMGSFYASHRSELLSHAQRILRDLAKAEEVVQDVLVKFMLAAPELSSAEHAVAYLHRSIENQCVDLFRAESRRPNLVLLDEASAEIEANWHVDGDLSREISAAEDAAVIRQALSLLSPAERAALVMWEMEGRSTSEIASELGIRETSVRHTVSRARTSFRKALSTIVVDQVNGLTALDLLSSTYRRTARIAKKSGRAVMSLVLLFSAFLGFNSLNGGEQFSTVIQTSSQSEGEVPATASSYSSQIQSNAFDEEIIQSNVTEEENIQPKANLQQIMDDLAFEGAQLESAIAMLEALNLLEGKE
jgi:RNA polymerase sigma factor (sigma-70 family)